jgi:hypothetical protein
MFAETARTNMNNVNYKNYNSLRYYELNGNTVWLVKYIDRYIRHKSYKIHGGFDEKR